MDDRQNKLLRAIIERYIQTAEPVASAEVLELSDLGVSPATIRNEMMELEHLGYLIQPHISAGRVPTLEGFHYYIDNLMEDRELERRSYRALSRAHGYGWRQLAREIAQMSDGTAFIAREGDEYYVAGLGRLLAQPEFRLNSSPLIEAAELMDQLERVVPDFFDHYQEEPTVLLGRENPFGDYCSTVIATRHGSQEIVMGVITPVRSNYARTISVIEEVMKLL